VGGKGGEEVIVKVNCSSNYDGEAHERLYINGRQRQSVGSLCECPEDAIIGRDLVSCCDIADFMEEAWKAGLAGEPFEYTVTEEKEDDE
jgi:hypothetical protein